MKIQKLTIGAAMKKPAKRILPTMSQLMSLLEQDDNLGFCIECGEEAYGVEPDARGYVCESCDQPGVYGAEELLCRGWHTHSDEE